MLRPTAEVMLMAAPEDCAQKRATKTKISLPDFLAGKPQLSLVLLQVPSILRGFSAPVRMTVEGQTDEHLQFLLANDSDEFNRWEAGQRLSRKLLLQLYDAASAAKVSSTDKEALQSTLADAGGVPDSLVNAFRAVLMEKGLDGSFKAMATTLPSGTELVDEIPEADPTLIYEVGVLTAHL
eukprot:1150931-Pelagomonas_calceolata.AAC.5